jgi:mannose/cellobiose epimerase-like protein (N-acyl-D-glucosamine 2-epimerase family)
LLDRYGHASGDNVCEADHLYVFALSRGLSSTDEFVVDGLSSEGSIIAGTKRLWPQAEMLKALVSKSRRGDAKAMRRIVPHVERMFDKYFIPGNGCWHDQLDAEGKVILAI